MAEWLGNGLQNRVQQFDSAWYLRTEKAASHCGFFCSEVPGVPDSPPLCHPHPTLSRERAKSLRSVTVRMQVIAAFSVLRYRRP